jgi:hypothetical protein
LFHPENGRESLPCSGPLWGENRNLCLDDPFCSRQEERLKMKKGYERFKEEGGNDREK